MIFTMKIGTSHVNSFFLTTCHIYLSPCLSYLDFSRSSWQWLNNRWLNRRNSGIMSYFYIDDGLEEMTVCSQISLPTIATINKVTWFPFHIKYGKYWMWEKFFLSIQAIQVHILLLTSIVYWCGLSFISNPFSTNSILHLIDFSLFFS